MSRPNHRSECGDQAETPFESYIKSVSIIESTVDGDTTYRFEAPGHTIVTFEDPDLARLYADVYFDVNGFREEGTGEYGIPPEIFQGGKDTLAAYLLTCPGVDIYWVASFLGVDQTKAERYVSWVRKRAVKIRERAREQGIE